MKGIEKKHFVLVLGFILLWALIWPSILLAEVPQQINYQGYLTDSEGNPLIATATMALDIYDAATGGNLLWGEVQTVDVLNGIFNVEIGQDTSGNPFPGDLFEGLRYLELTVNGETLTPRQHLTSSPFAMKAADADSLEGQSASEFSLEGHAHNWGQITGMPSGFADGIDDTGITNETDPTVTASVKDGVSWSEIQGLPAGFADGTDDVGIASETDPTVTASVKDGVSWSEIQGLPAGFADGTDDTGITSEADPQVGFILEGYMPYWTGNSLKTGGIYGSRIIGGPPDYDNYWKLGIGTTNPSAMLSVATDGDSTVAVSGENSLSGHSGKLGTSTYGAVGSHANGNYGILGWSYGVFGYNVSSSNQGMLAGPFEGAMGIHSSSNNYGQLGRIDYGAYGKHNSSGNWGALGTLNVGVEGYANSTSDWDNAIYGKNEGQGSGVYGWSQNRFGTVGVTASADPDEAGVWAVNNGTGPGIIATAGSEGYAGKFEGTVSVQVLEITGADLSEQYTVRGRQSSLLPTPGKVVIIDPENPGDLVVSRTAYDRKVAGIISGAGDIPIGMLMGKEGKGPDGKNPIALTGRVYCLADASNGVIEPGDLLTTSDTPGHAMKVSDYERAQGAILGKAMSSLEEGKGMVLVLVTLQ